jgi:hypothetical protein
MGVLQGFWRLESTVFITKLKKAFSSEYRTRLVACFDPSVIWVKKKEFRPM